jgi:hypothetical protein
MAVFLDKRDLQLTTSQVTCFLPLNVHRSESAAFATFWLRVFPIWAIMNLASSSSSRASNAPRIPRAQRRSTTGFFSPVGSSPIIFLQYSSAGYDPMTCLVNNETSFELAGLERQAAGRIPRMLRSTTTSYLKARQV